MNPKNQEKIDDWWKICKECKQKCATYTNDSYPVCSRCINKYENNSIETTIRMLGINIKKI